MKQNPPLTSEEAKKLTFPCLLEVWDYKNRTGHYVIISHITGKGSFVTTTEAHWQNAALPSSEIAEAMRKQFGTQSEYRKRMLVWDDYESEAEERIVIADLGEKTIDRYIVVSTYDESKFEKGEVFNWHYYKHAKPLPEVENQLREQLSELEKQLEIITQQINGIKTQIK
jgi:hypothetical protein